jgi:hypothetical protein
MRVFTKEINMSLDYRSQMYIEDLWEELVMLSEIQGQLDEESNSKTDKRIAEIHRELEGQDG